MTRSHRAGEEAPTAVAAAHNVPEQSQVNGAMVVTVVVNSLDPSQAHLLYTHCANVDLLLLPGKWGVTKPCPHTLVSFPSVFRGNVFNTSS